MGSFWSKRKRADPKPPKKGFCKRSQLSNGEIESHAMKRVESILKNEDSKKLLKDYLRKGHARDKSDALIRLECYELCDRILSNLEKNKMYLDDLIEFCDSKSWEDQINDARNADTSDEVNRQLKEILDALKRDCVHEMECNNDFTGFRRSLVEK